jgi:hypothetical protein
MFRDVTLSILTAVALVLAVHIVAWAAQAHPVTHPHMTHRVAR